MSAGGLALLAKVLVAAVSCTAMLGPVRADEGPAASAIEQELVVTDPASKTERALDLTGALDLLHIPSLAVAVLDNGRIAFVKQYGTDRRPLFQAASLSKLVTAVAALRLVQDGLLSLDGPVTGVPDLWDLPPSPLTQDHPVTLRGLLSMRGGIGVPGYVGYPRDAALPTLLEILEGRPPANSPPVRVETVPGSTYAYSGGGFEVVQGLIEEASGRPFERAMQELVLHRAGMRDSTFLLPLPRRFADQAATGHTADGSELPGGWRLVPELAAGGLWSTAEDMAKLLVAIEQSYRGADGALLSQALARAMLTPQLGGPYGLGAAVAGSGGNLVLMKRGQNVGYQSYLLLFPETGQGMVVMSGSDNGTTLATALIRRAAAAYGWPQLGALLD